MIAEVKEGIQKLSFIGVVGVHEANNRPATGASHMIGHCLLPRIQNLAHRAQLLEGRLALNPGLNLTLASFSCFQKHFLG